MTNETNSGPNNSGHGETEIVEKELGYAIVGCALRAYNELGFGYDEKIYGRALDFLLVERGLLVEREVAHQQVRSYLKASGYKLGLILHFGARFSSHRVLAPRLLDIWLRPIRRLRLIRMSSHCTG